jgi:predicted MFS family arabinose efflux permease
VSPASAPASSAGEAPATSNAYRWYVLGVLFLVTLFNVADRNIINTLLQPIKEEFGASDTQMGFLISVFAIMHLPASLAIAWLADRGVRRTIIATGLFIWSGLTALSGIAASFTHLVLARAGVSIAEGAGSSPAHSMLCDYFPLERRTTVLTIFGMGGIAGMALGSGVIGPIAYAWGWRNAFFVVGIPGALLSLVVLLSVREPLRGRFDGAAARAEHPGALEVLRYLLGMRSFVLILASAALHAVAAMGTGPYHVAYLMRSHGMNVATAGVAYMFVGPVASALGGLLFGMLVDRMLRRDVRWAMWIPALSSILALPFSTAFALWPAGGSFEAFGYALPTALGVILPASIVGAAWNGPTLSMSQSLARPRMRALASALTTSTYNLIGLGVGPLIVGRISDHFEPSMGADSLRYGLLIVVFTHVVGALLNVMAARHLRADLEKARS